MGKAIFFVKGLLTLGENCRFSNTCQLFSILAKHNFLKNFLTQRYTCWVYLDSDLHLVYFIMQNNPVTRELGEANWLEPLIFRCKFQFAITYFWNKKVTFCVLYCSPVRLFEFAEAGHTQGSWPILDFLNHSFFPMLVGRTISPA